VNASSAKPAAPDGVLGTPPRAATIPRGDTAQLPADWPVSPFDGSTH
jgi:hypothetical protein